MDAAISSPPNNAEPASRFKPGGMREVLALAGPMAISSATQAVLQLSDRLFLAWDPGKGVGAALSGGVLFWLFVCIPFGIAGFVQTFIAQYQGAGRRKEIGPILAQGIWVGVTCIPLALAIIPFSPYFLGQEGELAKQENIYFRISMLGAPAAVLSAAMGAYFTGRGKPSIEMSSSIVATAANILIDYAFIFGVWGAPKWGVAGAAFGTVIAQWIKVLILAAFIYLPKSRRENGVVAWLGLPNFHLLGRLLYFGSPAGLQYFVEIIAFAILVFFIRSEGEIEHAATSLALSLNMFAFTPVFGIGLAVSALVGRYLGQNEPQFAARSTWSAMWLAVGFTGICSIFYFGFPDLLFALHHGGVAGSDNELALALAKGLLRFAAIYCMLDAAQMIFVSALRGAGDTTFVFLMSSAVPLVFVFGGWFVRRVGGDFGVTGLSWWWGVVTLWLAGLFVVFAARFLWGRWKTMRVIEPEVIV